MTLINTARLSVVFLIALFGFTSPVAAVQPVDAPTPASFQFSGEEFFYSIRVNGVEAIRVGVRSGDVKYKKGFPYVPVTGTAQSTGFFDAVYSIDDKAHTFLHPETFQPIRSEKMFDENGSKRRYKVDFTHSNYKARVEKEKDDRTRKFTMAIPGTTHDMISWLYDLRARPEFKAGQKVEYFVYDGWKLSRIRGTVVGKEDVYTPLGWFKTWRTDFERDVMKSRRNRNKAPNITVRTEDATTASVWLSRDKNRLPVKLKVSTSFGAGEAVVVKFNVPQRQVATE